MFGKGEKAMSYKIHYRTWGVCLARDQLSVFARVGSIPLKRADSFSRRASESRMSTWLVSMIVRLAWIRPFLRYKGNHRPMPIFMRWNKLLPVLANLAKPKLPIPPKEKISQIWKHFLKINYLSTFFNALNLWDVRYSWLFGLKTER